MTDQRDIDNKVHDIFGDTSNEGGQNLDTLDQSDINDSTPGRASQRSFSSSNNPIQRTRDKLDDLQNNVSKIKDSAGKIKNGAETVQKAAGNIAKGTGKAAEIAGKVEKVAGNVAQAAGKVEKAAGNVEKGIGSATNLATDATALAEQVPGLLAAIPTLGISEGLALGAGGITEALGKGVGTTEQALGEATGAIGEATDSLGKASKAIGDATSAAGQGISSAGNISSGAGMGTTIGKSFLDKGLRKRVFKNFMPFGTRWVGDKALKSAEKEFGSISTWQLVIILIASALAIFFIIYQVFTFSFTYFMQMANGLMGKESSAGSSGPTTPYDDVTGNAIADFALSQQTDPYKWAAPGWNWSLFPPTDFSRDLDNGAAAEWDCSGLSAWAVYWGTAGSVNLPHSSKTQSTMGTEIAKADLQAGDLVFFGSPVHHVGVYIGNDKYVHAPKTGDVVKVSILSGRSDYATGRRFQ